VVLKCGPVVVSVPWLTVSFSWTSWAGNCQVDSVVLRDRVYAIGCVQHPVYAIGCVSSHAQGYHGWLGSREPPVPSGGGRWWGRHGAREERGGWGGGWWLVNGSSERGGWGYGWEVRRRGGKGTVFPFPLSPFPALTTYHGTVCQTGQTWPLPRSSMSGPPCQEAAPGTVAVVPRLL
jgi:hypothetical protein